MAAFTDRLSLQLLGDSFLEDLVGQLGLPALFAITYGLPAATVHEVKLAAIRKRSFQVPVFQTIRTRGSEDHLSAPPRRIHLDREQPRAGRLGWIDLLVEVELRVVVETRAMPLENIGARDLLEELGDPASIEDLRAALEASFGPSVTDAAFTKLGITNLEDFRRRAPRLLEFVSEPAPPFDPGDLGSSVSFPLVACLRLEPELDIAGALRQAQLCRSLLEGERQYTEVYGDAEVRRPYAFVTLFPASAATGDVIPGFTAEELSNLTRALFAFEEMAAHFVPGT